MDYRSIPDQIKEVLRINPRGMTVSDIARKIGMNGQSTGRHLDVLAAAGNVEVRTFGRSKVYYLSQRIPIFAMINLSQDMIILLDKELRIANVNNKFYEFTGVKKEDVINKNIGDKAFPIRFSPDIAPYSLQALEGKHFRIDALYHRADGDLYFQIKFVPMLYDNGDNGVTIIFEDITERKKVEAERSFLAAIVESSNDAIIGKMLDGTVTSWNKSAERIYGYSAAEMIGNNLSAIVPQELQSEVTDILEKVKNGERTMHYETERIRKDGKRILVSLTVSPIIGSDGSVLGASTIAYEVSQRYWPSCSVLPMIGTAIFFVLDFVLDLSCCSVLF